MTTTATKLGRPKLNRHGVRLEFFDQSPRKTALAKIKAEAVRIGTNGTRQGFKLAERLFRALPELKSV